MLFKREEIIQRVKEVPAWIHVAAALLSLTYFLTTSAVQYIYGGVVFTLATVESENTTAILQTSSAEDPDATLPPYSDKEEDVKVPLVQQEVLLVKSKPITSSVCGTLRHLRSRGASGFRGAGVALLYGLAFHWIAFVFSFLFGGLTGHVLTAFVAPVALTRVAMLWTHIVISEPSSKRFYQRTVSRPAAKKVIIPTLAVNLVQLATPIVPILTWMLVAYKSPANTSPPHLWDTRERVIVATQVLLVLFSFVFYVCAFVVPMSLALIRVYAAQLPEDETPIVPFDRTFGGLVVSEAEGGNGKLSLKAAWKSFDWNGRVRAIKVFVKMVVMLCFMTIFFFAAMGGLAAAGYHSTKPINAEEMHALPIIN